MQDSQVFLPFCLVAEFSDGQRIRFPGLDEQHCISLMEAVAEQHGDIAWYGGVTDENYTDGQYYKTLPQPPMFGGIETKDGAVSFTIPADRREQVIAEIDRLLGVSPGRSMEALSSEEVKEALRRILGDDSFSES